MANPPDQRLPSRSDLTPEDLARITQLREAIPKASGHVRKGLSRQLHHLLMTDAEHAAFCAKRRAAFHQRDPHEVSNAAKRGWASQSPETRAAHLAALKNGQTPASIRQGIATRNGYASPEDMPIEVFLCVICHNPVDVSKPRRLSYARARRRKGLDITCSPECRAEHQQNITNAQLAKLSPEEKAQRAAQLVGEAERWRREHPEAQLAAQRRRVAARDDVARVAKLKETIAAMPEEERRHKYGGPTLTPELIARRNASIKKGLAEIPAEQKIDISRRRVANTDLIAKGQKAAATHHAKSQEEKARIAAKREASTDQVAKGKKIKAAWDALTPERREARIRAALAKQRVQDYVLTYLDGVKRTVRLHSSWEADVAQRLLRMGLGFDDLKMGKGMQVTFHLGPPQPTWTADFVFPHRDAILEVKGTRPEAVYYWETSTLPAIRAHMDRRWSVFLLPRKLRKGEAFATLSALRAVATRVF